MKDLVSEYILTFCEVLAGLGIIYSIAKFAPMFMNVIN